MCLMQHKTEKGTRVSDSDFSRIFIDFRLDLKWFQTLLDSRKGLENILKATKGF